MNALMFVYIQTSPWGGEGEVGRSILIAPQQPRPPIPAAFMDAFGCVRGFEKC